MKKLLLPFLLLICFSTLAQDVTYDVSPEFKIKEGDATFIKIGDSYLMYEISYGPSQLAYTAKLDKVHYGITIHRYNAAMQEMQQVSLDDNKKQFGPFLPYFFGFAGKLNILYYQYTDDGAVKLFITQLDAQTLIVVKTTELFTFDQKNVGFFKMGNAIRSNDISAVISPDKTKILVVHSNTTDIHCFTTDEDLNILKSTVINTPKVEGFSLTSILLDNDGNKYLAYDYQQDKENHRGLIIDNNKNKPTPKQYNLNEDVFDANSLSFATSKDGKQVYLYGNYYENRLNVGVFIATLKPGTLHFNKPTLYPYPDDIKQRLHKLDFGDKRKGDITLRKIYYEFKMLDNGTIALSGVPSYSKTERVMSNSEIHIHYFAGPVVNIFINQKANFVMLPRDLRDEAATFPSECLYIPRENQLVCVYADKEKNINTSINDSPSATNDGDDLVLIAAVFDSEGNLLSRKKIAEKPGGKDYFLLSGNVTITNNSFLVPIGRQRANLTRYYRQYKQLATVAVK